VNGPENMLKLARMVQENIRGFTLGGGTAIMFKYDHRKSIDLDFFKEKPFSFNRLAVKMRSLFAVEHVEMRTDNLDIFIEGTKVSFVFFPFTPVNKPEQIAHIRTFSDFDLFLNKVYAAGRRIEPKDPYDAAWLLAQHAWKVEDIKQGFERKFPDQSFEIYLGALLSFKDYGELDDWVKDRLLELKDEM